MKKGLVIIGFVMIVANGVFAQTVADRIIPRSDLTRVPEAGESEIIIRSKTTGIHGQDWYSIYVEGFLVAQLEPGIPEKIIVKNGYVKLSASITEFNARRNVWNDKHRPDEIVVEAKSNSTLVDISASAVPLVSIKMEITRTTSLDRGVTP